VLRILNYCLFLLGEQSTWKKLINLVLKKPGGNVVTPPDWPPVIKKGKLSSQQKKFEKFKEFSKMGGDEKPKEKQK
jgi:hypothetical protein